MAIAGFFLITNSKSLKESKVILVKIVLCFSTNTFANMLNEGKFNKSSLLCF